MTYNQYRLFQPNLFPQLIQSILQGDTHQVEHILKKQPQLTPHQQPENSAPHILNPIVINNLLTQRPELAAPVLTALLTLTQTPQHTHDNRKHIEQILRPLQLPQHVIDMIITNPVILALIVCTPTPTGISDNRADILSMLHEHKPTNLESAAVQLPNWFRDNVNNGLSCLAVQQEDALLAC